MSLLKNLSPAIALLILSGCASSTPPSRPPIPANLNKPCPSLATFNSKSWDDLLTTHISLTFMYGECANKLEALLLYLEPR
ncbi:Rz1-like lysis system protein LysC [Sheuella amnicola]|uniref:Rz1-like lysis system protein LysC n=1 Tax=Sheuella amnicola TaxID=2707330 RepID=UPI004057AC07